MQQQAMTFPMTRQGVRDLDAVKKRVAPVSGGPVKTGTHANVNLGPAERSLSLLGGAVLCGWALSRPSLTSLLMGLAGAAFVQRGMKGHCELYHALGINHAGPQPQGQEMAYVAG